MLDFIWIIPALPLAAFIALAMASTVLGRRAISAIAVGPMFASCAAALLAAATFISSHPNGGSYSQILWTWFTISKYHVTSGVYVDPLSVVMTAVITFVASLIFLYSVRYMGEDDGYARFFAYMNLFAASMLILVLADNLLLLYLGWEGVGLCSYLLIGFWYKEPENCRAAIKAFVVTRTGDMLLLIALFMLFARYGSLDIATVMTEASRSPKGTVFLTIASLFVLSGAVGKSAQLPLQVWLPDAMAGPTPVSALIHAATMVTAGVYLIARTHLLFAAAPAAMQAVAFIGAATLLIAGFSAFVQKDIKRVLAYSTISQMGYMFLALGCGAWAAAIYHFLTHALFKSALFLGAGVLITAFNGEHDIFKMGGLRRVFPNTFRAFMAATLTLAAIPPLTITFNSKDVILNAVRTSTISWSFGFWVAGNVGAFMTAAYAFRLFYVVFFGEMKTRPEKKPAAIMLVPLGILAFLAAVAGLPDLLSTLFNVPSLYEYLQTALPQNHVTLPLPIEAWIMQIFYAAISLVAFAFTYFFYAQSAKRATAVVKTSVGYALRAWLFAGLGFDWLYYNLIVYPYVGLMQLNKRDVMDWLTKGNVYVFRGSNFVLSRIENGNLRWYVGGIGIGAMILLAIVILL